MAKHRYFELKEFIASDTAKKKGIDNTPTFSVVENLSELVEKILDPLRAAYGLPIRITSGYRCEKLNKAVGGVSNSVHQMGLAADLQVFGSFAKFKNFVVDWAKKSGVKFDQILLEKDSKGNEWIHISLRDNMGRQRGQIKTIDA